MKKIIIIFFLMFAVSVHAGFFTNHAEDAMNECREGANRGYSCISAGEWYSGKTYLNYHLALRAYKIGCRHGIATACLESGIILNEGKGNVDTDHFSAIRFFIKSCDLYDSDGCASLALMYSKGKGVIQSDILSAKYEIKSCNLGSASGCNNLGISYQYGMGVEKSKAKALKYYRKACDLEEQDGCDNYGKLR